MSRRRISCASFHTPSGRSPAGSGMISIGMSRSRSRSASALTSSPSDRNTGR
jgi:hypothetical protein